MGNFVDDFQSADIGLNSITEYSYASPPNCKKDFQYLIIYRDGFRPLKSDFNSVSVSYDISKSC